ncbi:MFS transporter [Rickettsiales endosymbiont of Stachyamoeba lipophora]|uniref:MFS transporter n=1 Tax=Rickettsiales endosymbiont of Stachyamoeba lipophora TaxID=2486578 RepID=UPI000F6529A0|nr:MFS transporter [Rickettsiales endosymbiont of Stachyamoeba lipophora]AZL15507.1 MFS transporter [Rickettsiales endosymbiont of Stachyamoeba lipophora]
MNQSKSLLVWLIGALFYAYQYVLRVVPNLILPELTNHFGMNEQQIGQISGIYYIGYALMHIPVGIMLDRFKLKYVLPIMSLIATAGMIPLVISDVWVYPLLGRFLLGCGSTAAILGLFKIINLLFPPEKFSRMLSIAVTIGLGGAIYAGAPLDMLMVKIGWREIIWGLIYLGVGLSVAFYLFIPRMDHIKPSKGTPLQDLKIIFSHPTIILICITGGLMIGPLEGFADTWGKQFFKTVYNFDNQEAAWLTSLVFIGMCFGAPLVSLMSEKLKNDIFSILICNFIMILAFGWLLSQGISKASIAVIMTMIGVASSYQITIVTLIMKLIDSRLSALASAVANMIMMLFGYLFHTIIGLSIKFTSEIGLGVVDQYKIGITMIPLMMLGALLILLSLYRKVNRQVRLRAHI